MSRRARFPPGLATQAETLGATLDVYLHAARSCFWWGQGVAAVQQRFLIQWSPALPAGVVLEPSTAAAVHLSGQLAFAGEALIAGLLLLHQIRQEWCLASPPIAETFAPNSRRFAGLLSIFADPLWLSRQGRRPQSASECLQCLQSSSPLSSRPADQEPKAIQPARGAGAICPLKCLAVLQLKCLVQG